ncbi:Indoleamine 2,3-dioxygenase [Ceratobasidium theobromae]|uniref:Indoleamine 2,3-dioxygenase n=1 Tax=Ceratobasidium theobromae TaxID=1582974 RepID=A0A5N5QW09_9AGAM|nr:Indoleamine 2,3-dioxygenase [Ceratobasidium theobromae]
MASVLSWFSSALGSAAQSWLGARPVASPRPSPSKVDLSYFSSSRFELDAQTAFMPPEPPLARLDGEHESWELLLDAASQNFTCPGDEEHVPESQVKFGESWRRSVREQFQLPTLSIQPFELDIRRARRAHHVLAFITQFYVQSLPPRQNAFDRSPIVIPASIAIPFVGVSRQLDIAPIVTYADTVLWNWELIDRSQPMSTSNIRIKDLFTRDPQEEHFFLTSARIEIRGLEAMDIMAKCARLIDAGISSTADEAFLASQLARLAVVIDDISAILDAVREGCDPMFFYFTFRPWIRGADQGAESPMWLYEGVDGKGIAMQCSGPSAGQSALMHSFDVFLDVVHPNARASRGCSFSMALPDTPPPSPGFPSKGMDDVSRCPFASKMPIVDPAFNPHARPARDHVVTGLDTPPLTPVRSEMLVIPADLDISEPSKEPLDTSFLGRMRKYMPGGHQLFLEHLRSLSFGPTVRELIRGAPHLAESYNSSIQALSRFRDAHIRVVTRYVICPARSKTIVRDPSLDSGAVRGTGGTSLVPLLKVYRNETLSCRV